MSAGPAVAAFAAGTIVSLVTSWLLVTRLERVGERLGLSEALLGMVAALAADAPEITSAVSAAAGHQRVIGAGVVLGSNVFNLAALLGLGAVVARVRLHRRVVALGGAVALWVALASLGVVGAVLPPWLGIVLVAAVLAGYLVLLGAPRGRVLRLPLPSWLCRWLCGAVDEEELELAAAIRPRRGGTGDTLLALAATIVVVAASVAMERGASVLGRRFGVPEIVVGALVLAAVTSLPNAVAAVYLARKGRGAAALSTALNSNNLNVLCGLLLPAVAVGLAPSGSGLLAACWYVGLTALTLALAWATGGLDRPQGWAILAGYLAFVLALTLAA